MCGIIGVLDLQKENRIDRNILMSMTDKISHRGPDAVDFYLDHDIGIGFTRLSIIDLETGMQPIFNEDQSVVISCNGEIFNYLELRKILIDKGHKFRSNSDVEVLVHMYEEYGTDFLNKLNGQFAFVIYDKKRKLLFCARDHVGIVPFFYTQVNGLFIFASEIKAIIEHPMVKREVDVTGLDQILTFPGLIGSRTLFKEIKSLENGNYLTINFSGDIKIYEYWDLNYPKVGEIEYSKSHQYYIDKLDELLTASVKYRLQADVPVGIYISGGLDSSLVASKAALLCPDSNLKSFSIDFTDKQLSEARFQSMMVNFIKSQHHTKVFGITDIVRRLQKSVLHSESAIKETYNTASLALSEMARLNGVKVILAGEGADELFGGYVGYRFDKFRNSSVQEKGNSLSEEMEINKHLWGNEHFIYEKNYYEYQNIKKNLLSKDILQCYDDINCFNYSIINKEKIDNVDILHRRSYIDFKLRLPEHLLADHGDRMLLANSIEGRYPFLDIELVEFAKKIPPELKLMGFDEKYILKKIGEKKIPEEIIKRQKFSFVAPGSPELLKEDTEYFYDLLSHERIKKQGYFNPDTVVTLRDRYMKDGFKLNLPFENDLLIMVITFGIFLDSFSMPCLGL